MHIHVPKKSIGQIHNDPLHVPPFKHKDDVDNNIPVCMYKLGLPTPTKVTVLVVKFT